MRVSACVYTPEASCVRVFDPVSTLLFDLYHYLEQNGAFDYHWNTPQVLAARSFLVAGFDTRFVPRRF